MSAHRKRPEFKAPFERQEVDRWWGSIEGRLEQRRLRRPVLLILAGAAALALGVGWRGRATRPSEAVMAPSAAGPLTLSGQSAPVGELLPDREITLSDQSSIVAQGPVAMSVLENSATRFEVRQGPGQVRYEVTPGGPRRWTIDCALASIEVVGTGFTVDSEARKLRVRVAHGVVLVRGERVPERVQRLVAGEEIVISAGGETPRAEGSASSDPGAVASGAPSASSQAPLEAQTGELPRGDGPRGVASRVEAPRPESPPTVASAAAVSAPSWRVLASQGSFKDAYSELGAGGVARASSEASVSDLFALADVARFSGHAQEAVGPLAQIVQRGGTQAALAAFTLGRTHMDQMGEPAAAAQDFERAVGLGLGGGLREDALVRRVEALARAGQQERAAEAARVVAEQNPALKKRVERWLPR